jgi:hypothetical protein
MINAGRWRTLAVSLRRVLWAAGAAGLAGTLLAGGTPASAAMVAAAPGAAGPRAAVSCSGDGCDGQNPYGSGCFNSGGEVIYNVQLTDGLGQGVGAYVRLWYSTTCRTVWASMYNAPYSSGGGQGDADIHRNSDNHRFDCTVPLNESSCYTAMLYDGGTTSHAHATFNSGTFPGTAQATTPDF